MTTQQAIVQPSRAPRAPWLKVDRRYLAPALITCVLLAGQLTFGFLESWSRTFLAIATAILTELVVVRALYGAWPHLASAYVSGISVGILVRSPAFWPYALCSAISITSKYVLRVRERHLWNPTNFGVVMLLLLAPDAVAGLSVQWGNNLLPMVFVWAFGVDHWTHDDQRDCADHGADVSALHLLHGHGPEDHGAPEVGPVAGGFHHRGR